MTGRVMKTVPVLVCCAAILLSGRMIPAQAPADADEIDKLLSKLRYEWHDEELPAEVLTIDPDGKRPGNVTSGEAAEDVERLFYLLSHGYSGYGFFADAGNWQRAKEQILSDLQARSTWRIADLPEVLEGRLDFIHDGHIKIGNRRFADHLDFWYDTTLEVHESGGAYRCELDGEACSLVRIGGGDPDAFLYPSLNRRGEFIHRIGMLARFPPDPLSIEAVGTSGPLELAIPLHRSHFDHYAGTIFQRDRVGGIPVLRVRSFGDGRPEILERWLDTADELRGEPCVIVDIRGNRGGNERWPIEWIRRLTGKRAESVFIFSELHSRTTMAGRANAFIHWRHLSPDNDFFVQQSEHYADLRDHFGPGGSEPFWSGPHFPNNPTIPNETTVIVITNGLVASAGEGFVMRVTQAENVVVVGENTMGALTFGNISLHRLPNSGIDVWLPINFGLFPDGVMREEKGLEPDYWVPAADALNCAVAAVRNGTIATARPLPAEWMEQPFVPEDARHLRRKAFFIGLLTVLGAFWLFWGRKRPLRLAAPGIVWLAVGALWIFLGGEKHKVIMVDAGMGLLALGLVLFFGGLLLYWRTKRLESRQPT